MWVTGPNQHGAFSPITTQWPLRSFLPGSWGLRSPLSNLRRGPFWWLSRRAGLTPLMTHLWGHGVGGLLGLALRRKGPTNAITQPRWFIPCDLQSAGTKLVKRCREPIPGSDPWDFLIIDGTRPFALGNKTQAPWLWVTHTVALPLMQWSEFTTPLVKAVWGSPFFPGHWTSCGPE